MMFTLYILYIFATIVVFRRSVTSYFATLTTDWRFGIETQGIIVVFIGSHKSCINSSFILQSHLSATVTYMLVLLRRILK